MRVLLATAPTLGSMKPMTPESIDNQTFKSPPMGLLYIATYLRDYISCDLKIADFDSDEADEKDIQDCIDMFSPDVIGITVCSPNLYGAFLVAKITKKINPETLVVWGGPHISLYPDESIRLVNVDYCITGDGEVPFTGLIDAIKNDKNINNVKGLLKLQDDRIIYTGEPEPLNAQKSFIIPDRTLTDYKKYYSLLFKGEVMTTILTTRGQCPYKCTFCSIPDKQVSKKLRLNTVDNIIKEIKACTALGIKNIFFIDDLFTINKKRVIEVCKEIIKQKINFNWEIHARVDVIDEEMLSYLKKANCKRIRFGIEAGSQRILDLYKKNTSLSQIQEAIKLTKKYRIEIFGYFMLGALTESRKEVMNTVDLAVQLNLDFVRMTVLTPFPGTQMYNEAISTGKMTDFWLRQAKDPQPNLVPEYFEWEGTNEELRSILNSSYRKIYLRPVYMLRKFMAIRSTSQFKAYVDGFRRILKAAFFKKLYN